MKSKKEGQRAVCLISQAYPLALENQLYSVPMKEDLRNMDMLVTSCLLVQDQQYHLRRA